MVIVDTSIIIDHLRQPEKVITPLMNVTHRVSRENLALSVISVQELFTGQSCRDPREYERLIETISPLHILSYTFDTAQRAGELMRDSRRSLEFADAAIAACAIINGASLYTLNTKDFIDIPGLDLYRL